MYLSCDDCDTAGLFHTHKHTTEFLRCGPTGTDDHVRLRGNAATAGVWHIGQLDIEEALVLLLSFSGPDQD